MHGLITLCTAVYSYKHTCALNKWLLDLCVPNEGSENNERVSAGKPHQAFARLLDLKPNKIENY